MKKKRKVVFTTKSHKGKSKKKVFEGYDNINKKLDDILLMQKKILNEENKVEQEEKKLEDIEKSNVEGEKKEDLDIKQLDKDILSGETVQEEELAKLEKLEEEIKKDVGEHPLRKISLKDVVKGLVGAFVGLAVHYTFTYGVEISENLDMTRASFLFILAFFVGLLFIYATGFRKIKDPKILMFMPVRLMLLYITSVIMSIFVLYVFYPNFGHEFLESYKMVAGVLLAAVVGACTADLIGKE